MTALERAVSVVTAFAERPEATPDEHTRWLIDAIHRAIIEHSNAELERRRVVERELNVLTSAIAKRPLLADAVKKALLVDAQGCDAEEQAKRKQIREDNMIGEAGI